MLRVDEYGSIELTRGDTARLTVSIKNDVAANESYTVQPGDTLTLSMKKNIEDAEPCLQKTIVGETTFHIKPEDTAGLAFGKYVYDVQIVTEDGDVYTIIEPTTFQIMQEVTC